MRPDWPMGATEQSRAQLWSVHQHPPEAKRRQGEPIRLDVRHESRALGCRHRSAARATPRRWRLRGRRRLPSGTGHGSALGVQHMNQDDLKELFLRYARRDGLLGLATAAAAAGGVGRQARPATVAAVGRRGPARSGQTTSPLLGPQPVPSHGSSASMEGSARTSHPRACRTRRPSGSCAPLSTSRSLIVHASTTPTAASCPASTPTRALSVWVLRVSAPLKARFYSGVVLGRCRRVRVRIE